MGVAKAAPLQSLALEKRRFERRISASGIAARPVLKQGLRRNEGTMKDLAPLRYGLYVTPVVTAGVVVECEVRGLVQIVGLSRGPIRWPIGERDGKGELVVFKGLARAVRQESPPAVAAAWGVSLATAERWKTACCHPRRRKKQTRAAPPIAWKAAEDELLATTTLAEAARLMGRTLTAVSKRRRMLGLPDGRLAPQKAHVQAALNDRSEAACQALRLRTAELAESLEMLRLTCAKSKVTIAFWRSLNGLDADATAVVKSAAATG
jgi:hypothetical protein